MAMSVLPMYTPMRLDSIVPAGLAAGRRAIALDPNLSDAHLGYANMLIYQYKWPEAEEHFKRALTLDPANATAHQWYGDYLYVIGRVGEAIPALRRATELDPLSPVLYNDLGYALRSAGRPEEAIEAVKRATELDPAFVWAFHNLAGALHESGKTDSAIAILEKRDLKELSDGDGAASLISAYVRADRRDDAQRVLESVRALRRSAPEGLDLMLGLAHGAIGNVDSAFYWVSRSIERHEGYLFASNVPCAPALAGLRTDPRFDELLKRLGASRCQTQVPR